jgi:holo-[acyl-carrier protein] synthase
VIVGIGTDVCDVGRLQSALARTPSLAARIFTEAEVGLPPASLAARFAAKESVAKALGRPRGARWRDAEVRRAADGRPVLFVAGYEHLTWHVSLAHDAGIATAFVIAEDRGGG